MPVHEGDLRVRPDLRYVASGRSTLVTDVRGRIDGMDPQGFFLNNTRFLSAELITVDGRPAVPFSTATVGPAAQLSYAELADRERLPSRAAYLALERFVESGMRSRLRVESFADSPRDMDVCLSFTADFADTEEAERHGRRQQADVRTDWNPETRELSIQYGHSDLDLAVAIRIDTTGSVSYRDGAVHVALPVPARGSALVEVAVEPIIDGHRYAAPVPGYDTDGPAGTARAQLAREFTGLRTTAVDVALAWRTATADLAALPLGEPDGPAAPIAGLPVYQQIFGRDTLTASWQALLAGPTMLRDSLHLNAAYIGQRRDDWRDEEPGKLLHQARRGPLSQLGLDPFDRYYGDWATPPDFLVFLGQYLAWTGDTETVRELLPAARQVLGWLDSDADPDRDGFLEYRRRSPAGVKNQGWKDSETAIVDEHGNVVDGPIASSELQGYHYAALRHAAGVFMTLGQRAVAGTLFARAARLRRRFHATYWMPDRGCYALALDADHRPVRSMNSNDGHLLATGIVPAREARRVAERLFEPDMFTGWGIRTLSAEHPAYNPFSYHRGSVWPVESGTIALGLARYGCWEQLHRLAEGTFAAAALYEGHRLPEVLSGLPRDDEHRHPGFYPSACSPQAWSASAIVALIQALLALRPLAALDTVVLDPHLPAWLPELHLDGVQINGRTFDLSVRRTRGGGASVRARGDQVNLVRAATWQSRPLARLLA